MKIIKFAPFYRDPSYWDLSFQALVANHLLNLYNHSTSFATSKLFWSWCYYWVNKNSCCVLVFELIPCFHMNFFSEIVCGQSGVSNKFSENGLGKCWKPFVKNSLRTDCGLLEVLHSHPGIAHPNIHKAPATPCLIEYTVSTIQFQCLLVFVSPKQVVNTLWKVHMETSALQPALPTVYSVSGKLLSRIHIDGLK